MNETRQNGVRQTVVSVQRLQSGKKRAQFRLVAEVQLAVSKDEAFRLLSDPRELNELTPSWFQLRFLSTVPGALSVGSTLHYRLRLGRTLWRWTSRIDRWEPPSHFSYTQERGPFTWFWHDHQFEEIPGGTLARDVVEYSVLGGWVTHRLICEPWLRRIFEFRAGKLLERLGPVGPTGDGR